MVSDIERAFAETYSALRYLRGAANCPTYYEEARKEASRMLIKHSERAEEIFADIMKEDSEDEN